MEELLKLLQEQRGAFDAFKADLVKRVRELETRAARPGGVPAGDPAGEADAMVKTLTAFARGALDVKTMTIGTPGDGGNTVGPEFDAQINRVALNYSPMRKLARVVKAQTGQWNTLVATSDVGAQVVGETDARNDSTTPNLEKVTPKGGALAAIAPITSWLLEDSEYDLYQFIIESIGRSFGIKEGQLFLTGTGLAGQAQGLLTLPAPVNTDDGARAFGTLQYIPSGQAGTLGTNLDPLISALYRLKPEYRQNAAWVMHPSTAEVIRKFKDANNLPIWQPSSAAGQPPTLLGAPCHEDSNMPVIAANALAIAVGDFKAGYVVVDSGTPKLLRDEVTTKGMTKVYYERRVYGSPVDTNAIKLVKIAAA